MLQMHRSVFDCVDSVTYGLISCSTRRGFWLRLVELNEEEEEEAAPVVPVARLDRLRVVRPTPLETGMFSLFGLGSWYTDTLALPASLRMLLLFIPIMPMLLPEPLRRLVDRTFS